MPLSADEFKKLTMAIFYASGMNVINGGWTMEKRIVVEILNDYSPDCKATITYEDGQNKMEYRERVNKEEASGK